MAEGAVRICPPDTKTRHKIALIKFQIELGNPRVNKEQNDKYRSAESRTDPVSTDPLMMRPARGAEELT